MRWQNTETPTFAGSAGSGKAPAVAETFILVDRDGNTVATFTKTVAGVNTLDVAGAISQSGITLASAFVYKGTIDCSTNPNWPAASAGDVYKVSVAGKIGGASGQTVQAKDMLICNADGSAGTDAAVGANWMIEQGNIVSTADVPASTNKNYVTDAQLVVIGNTSGTNTGDQSSVSGNAGTVTNGVYLDSSQTLTKKIISLTAAHSSDNTYEGEQITGLNAGATIAQFEVVYLGGSSTWLLADANGSGTYPARGLAVAAYSNTNPAAILVKGTVRHDAWNWTPGGTIYLSGTAGALTQIAPSTSGDNVQQVGFALKAGIAFLDFNSTYVTLT